MPSTPQDAAPGVRRAFLIADIRGYSTFTRERGDAAAARLATKFADLARDSIEARGGSVIELRGDEALAVFVSSGQAVRAGLEFQEGCREATDEDPELPLPVGIGIAVGEAVPVEDGFRGAALNLAARLCSKAVAGQVLVTEAVLAESSSVPHLVFEPLDAVELKGFDRPVELFEARSTEGTPLGTAAGNADADGMPGGLLPRELDDPAPLVGRDHELRWLRGTWRRARRGHGRLVFVSGPPGIGKTRLAAELAAFVLGSGGEVRLAGAGGDALARALGEIGRASSATAASLVILDEVDVLPEVAERLDEVAPTIANRPVLILGLFRDADRNERLAGLVAREDADGDGHRVLGPLGAEDAHAMAVAALGDVGLEEFPAEAIARSSGGVPARMQEAIGDWARDEAARRLAAAAEWMTEGRTRQSAGLDFAANLIARNLGRIYGSPPATTEASAVEPECPYRGLAAFGEDDAPLYFGRERLVGEVAARTVGAGLLAVVGPSGSGKSSLVMAGLLPSLAAGLLPGSARWGHVVLRPGDHPMDALQTALLQKSPGTRLVLVVDQFEETFTTAADEDERGAFVDRLVELAGDPEGSVVVLTIRADYTGHCAPYPELARLLAANLVLVGPMTPDETRRAIELPARRAGVRVESALAEALVEEVGEEPGALPLLSTALVELWHARDGAWMRLEARGRTGGIRGAVARLAESSYDELTEPERDTARAVFLRLVGQGEGDAAVRRQVAVTEFDIERDPTLQRVLDRLTDDRLLTRDDGRIEIAHEALIREWPRLRTWLEEDATGRALRTHLTQSARQWDERDRDRDSGDLYRGARLSATLDWAQDHDRELNAVEREFLAQGRQAGDAEAERQRRTNRRLRGLLVGTAVFLIVALVAGGLALVQRGHARTAQAAAESQALTSDAERVGTLARTEPSLDRSFLLGVAGVRLEDVPETRGDLLAVLQDAPGVVRFLQASPSGVPAFAASPDGRLLATGDSAGIVRFHDLATSRLAGPTVDVGGPVSLHAMAFSPDGRTVAVGTTTGLRANVVMVDVAGRSARQFGSWPSVPASAGPIRFLRMAFAPDGAHVAVAVATSKPPLPVAVGQRLLLLDLQGHVVWDRDVPVDPGQNETQVEFLPDGAIVTSAQQGETRLWDLAT
ncbi:MAG TPA: AAA family ATPase, partial [Actinomycetota bacterium]|nr:AAA family ATPase [Actinomycetota bacterium]